ncbi:alpha/beta hydrolase [Mycobacterium xenopi]|nr:alpha/beta hydrolase-fold protein [Mycobacterium xenopi]MDA3637869.1 alpha/beta hydrolase-fold protein [Mycobacterium xenopi]MDA3655938.1 alpha/beta hydrolase-fold protein [Mycobacterium xenopi]MDA3660744.1 alpha/beta hydrolase-fold protein [Mycobacterium xenopi]SPX88570.1 esterase family protein [Mycobacterium xenopi]
MNDVPAWSTTVAAPLLVGHHTSLMHGWLPITIQALTAVVLVLAVGRRSRRWWMLRLPVAAAMGVAVAVGARWFIDSDGLADDPAPLALWLWVALTGAAAAVLLVGWRSARWWRRAASIGAVPLCLLSSALALNEWVGYFPTVQTAWNQVTAGPLPDQTDKTAIAAMAGKPALPPRGSVVPVTIPADASHFKHRGELVYLPPAWFASTPPPRLPTVMMIGGEFNTPADWLRAGNAVTTIDEFAAAHGGNAPVLVFVDSGGAFNNDTECVNGTRGNAADHLTKDVLPFMVSTFGVSPDRSNWGVVGWSMGGTCAVDLTVMHPELFSTFVDIAGDLGPNSGTKAQTIARLFGGNAAAWAAFDPTTVIKRHGPYSGVSGWFAVNSDGAVAEHPRVEAADTAGVVGRAAAAHPNEQAVAAESLCTLGRAKGIDCAVIAQPGKHDWPFAGRAFTTALPWLAGQVGTPGVPRIPLPSASSPPAPAPGSVPHRHAAQK